MAVMATAKNRRASVEITAPVANKVVVNAAIHLNLHWQPAKQKLLAMPVL